MTAKKVTALILIFALLAAGGYYLLKTEKEDSERMKNLYDEVEPLEREREILAEELGEIETEYKVRMRDYATVEIVFTELDRQIISDVWPIMRSRNIIGLIPLSFREMPGYWNKLTVSDIQALIGDGWGLYLLYENEDFTYWHSQLERYAESIGLSMPTTVYFKMDNYSHEMDEELIACGIKTVILNASDGRSSTVSDPTAPLWITGAMPFGYTGSLADLEFLGRTDGGNLVLTMKLNETWDTSKLKNTAESAEKRDFISVLDDWADKELLYSEDPLQDMETVGPTPYIYVDTNDPDVLHEIYLDSLTPEQQLLLPKIKFVNVETALNQHRNAVELRESLTKEMNEKKKNLEQRIQKLDMEIAETYKRYETGNPEKAEQGS